MTETIRFTLNGKPTTLETDASRKLLWALRTDLELTGTKYGCGIGMCGACTVLLDGQATRSCVTDLAAVRGKQVLTIEGLATNGEPSPLQQAFYEHDGYQCGYCTSGMIMNAHGLLLANRTPTREQIVQGMEGNLCRCGAYKHIVAAIEAASGQGRQP
jgi:aerobic-type carbon monoxide dehydrogenase small subunit (CoxS/CutS family)